MLKNVVTPRPFFTKTLLIISTTALLTACGGGSSHDDDHDDHEHDHNHAGRLLFIKPDGSLGMYDQTEKNPDLAFSSPASLATNPTALQIANNGLTAAIQTQSKVVFISSGLEHLNHDHAHTHEVKQMGNEVSGTKVIATDEHFSVLDTDTTIYTAKDGLLAAGFNIISTSYPALVLEDDHLLVFNPYGSNVKGQVVNSTNTPVTPEVDFTCNEVKATAQADDLAMVLCENDTLYGVVSYEDSNHSEVFKTKLSLTGITNLTSSDDFVVAWSKNALWKVEAHGSHTHAKDLSRRIDLAGKDICSVAVDTEAGFIAALLNNGEVNLYHPTNTNSYRAATIADISACGHALISAGAMSFMVLDSKNGKLYNLDSHGHDFHVHGAALSHPDLLGAKDAIFMHDVGDHDHDDDHDDHGHAH